MRKYCVPSLLISTILAATLCLGGLAGGAQGKGVSIALTVRETSGIGRTGEPVTVGVPLSRASAIYSAEGLRVLDGSGREVPAQFQVTSRWGGAPGDAGKPARWLLVDFEADVGGGGTAAYQLSSGGAQPPATGLRVTKDDADTLRISTGAADFAFNKKKFNVFDSVRVGGGEVVSAAGQTGIVAVDQGGRTFSSSAKAPRSVSLETDGPVRKTVKIVGTLAGASGDLLDCVARVSLFAGSSDAKVQLTVRNMREPQVIDGQPEFCDIGCPNSAAFESLDLVVNCTEAGVVRLGGVSGGDRESGGSVQVYQDSSGGRAWNRYQGRQPRPQSYVSFKGYKAYRDGAVVASGDRPKPWLGTKASRGGAVVSVRDFWQNYPKALRGAGGKLEVSLFPREYAGPYSFRPGEQKTHDVAVCFHGPGQEAAARLRAAASQDPLVAAPSSECYMTSGVLGRVTGLTGDAEFSSYEALNGSTIEGGTGTDLFDVIEDAEFYSWQDYGEEPLDFESGTGSFNQKYNFDLGMLIQYMRTGDIRWWRLADAAGRHTADLDIYHNEGVPTEWWDGGFFGHSYHDEENNTNPNRNYGRPHPDLVFGAPGLFQRYYMTGDMVAFEAAREIGDNIRYRFDNTFGRGNGQGYADAPDYENGCQNTRPFAHGLWVLVDAYRATGDPGYLSTAEWLITNTHQATDLFITSPVAGDRRYTKLFTWELLINSLGKYLDLCAEMGRSDPSGAKEQLVAMTRQEAHVMWKQDASGNKGVPYAWMRDGTPWGWEDYEVAVNVCNWHLLTADAMTYGYIYGGDASMLDRAREAFKTGSDPEVEYFEPVYTATKEATNSANFGLVYMNYRYPPSGPPVGQTQFDEWLCLENPGSQAAKVTIEYFTSGGSKVKQGIEVPAGSRRTVDVNAAVGAGQDVSAKVTSTRAIVAERPMYFDYHGAWRGGHVASGATGESTEWYFAEGCTRAGFEEWITIANTGAAAGEVTLTYMMEGGAKRIQKVNAAAGSRTTVSVNAFLGEGHDVSTLVESKVPVVVERPMYFDYHGSWKGGHDVLGATAPSERWYFGEGTTRSNPADGYYEQWLCLQNPGAGAANVSVDFLLDGGGVVSRKYQLAPTSRTTVDVMREVGPNRDVSTVVSSDVPLVAERPLYFATREGWDGGDVAVGSTEPLVTRYFAEGCTREGFQTWLSIGNPQAADARVTVTYYTGSGRTFSRDITVPASGRSTVDVNLDVGAGEDVSFKVTSAEPVVVERPMYFNYHGIRAGGHDGTGAAAPALEWYFAEGCTR
ncbi:MAG: DUF5719 family protein [Candidatus Geothermincolia bacterium]